MSTHSYAIWDAKSELTLCNVPWDMNYRDVVRFSSAADLDTYIDGLDNENRKVITNASYVKASEPISLDDPFNTVSLYNYIRVRKTAQPTSPAEPEKTYYYFITGIEHVAPNNTRVTVQLDVISTYIYGIEFGNTFVERGHVGIAQKDNFADYGKKYLTAPEGLSLGDEYYQRIGLRDVLMNSLTIASVDPPVVSAGSPIMVVSTIDLSEPSEWVNDDAGPNTPPATPTIAFGAVTPYSIRIFKKITEYSEFIFAMRKFAWIAQGIIGVYAIPDIKKYLPDFDYDENSPTGVAPPAFIADGTEAPFRSAMRRSINLLDDWRNDSRLMNTFGDRYRHLKKFLTSPYTVIEYSADSGNAIILRPELMQARHLWVVEVANLYMGDMNVRYHPATHYNDSENTDLFTMIGSLPAIGTTNDNASVAQASFFYQREYATDVANLQKGSAALSATISRLNTETAISQQRDATRIGNNSSSALNDIAIRANNQTLRQNQDNAWVKNVGMAGVGGAVSGAGGGIPGIVGGAAVGAGLGAASTYINNEHMSALNTINNNQMSSANFAAGNAAIEQSQSSARAQQTIANRNEGLANSTANTNYLATMLSLEAQEKSAGIIAPSLGAQRGGEIGRYVDGGLGIRAKIKTIDDSRIRSIGELWLRFGYAINSFMKPPRDLHCMSRFTYWLMSNTYIVKGRMPEMHKNAIRGIFERGVTVWKNPNDIGTIDPADNNPIVRDYY